MKKIRYIAILTWSNIILDFKLFVFLKFAIIKGNFDNLIFHTEVKKVTKVVSDLIYKVSTLQ